MKRKSLLFTLLIALIVPFAAQAQETVTIGDGTSTDYYTPIGTYYNYSITEQLYTADEIGMAGTINSISFNYASTIAKDFPITVYMANVDAENLSTGISLADAEVVFEGTYSVTGEGWMTITLDTPFAYDGTSNLLIGINKDYVYWFSGNWNHTATEAVMARYSNNDNSAYTTTTVPASTRTSRPNIQMVITPGSGVTCEKPENLEATNVTENGATLTWTGGSGNYNVEYKLASDTEWTSFLANTTATTCNLTGLTPGSAYQARVQSVCGDATSGWKSVNFTTTCGAITTFPWTETFESYASGDFIDPCWVNEHIEGTGTQLFKVSTSSNADNATHQLQLPDMAGGTLTKLVLPEMTLPANYEFSLDIYRSNSTYNNNYPYEGIRVYASTDGEIEGATELAFIPRQYNTGNDVIPAESAVGWYTYELPIGMSGTCYIILRGESQYCTATYMDNLTVKAMPTCPKPTGLAVTANSVTAHNATITWTENGEANTWIVEYSTSADFAEVLTETDEDAPTYTFVGLEPETTYYVRVKAHCGDGDESEYSNVVNFTTAIACPAPTGLAVNPTNYSATVNWNGTSDSYIVSYRTAAYADGLVEEFNNSGVPSGWTRYSGLVDEVIAGEADLTTMNSGWASTTYALGQYNMKVNIYGTSVKYWLVTPEFNLSQNLSFDLALTKYNSSDPIADATAQTDDRFVVLIYVDNAWHILREWNNSGSEYVYNAISATGENVNIDLSAYNGQNVKIAFYGESTASGGDNDLHIDNVVCGTPYAAGEWQTITTTETTATITDLNPETAYEVKVQGDCGELDGVSLETAIVPFTTLEGCPAPQNLEVDDITYNSAAVAWDGYNDSYNVSYRMAAHSDGIIEHFDAQSIPAGWTRYSGLVDQVVAGTAELSLATSGWALNTYALGEYNMKLNIYGESYVKYWLVTPEFNLSQNLSFDLALTDYNNSNPIENPEAQADDRFVVLIYADNAWHILREWNNSGSEYVYNTISTTGENVTIDLSAYYGKKVKIAFYGESTSSTDENAGDNDLHIDNIVCGTPVEAGEWETVEATESPVVLTDLTPETPYEVKVQGVCGETETEWTEIVTFTTLEEPITYTLTIEGYEDDNNESGYYLIASPVTVDLTNHEMTTGDFDLYAFDQAQDDEWRNYKQNAFSLEPGKGYLYAHKTGGEFTLTGTAYSGDGEIELVYDDNAVDFKGWNLVGNPWGVKAYPNHAFYTMAEGGAGIDVTPNDANTEVAPMTGIFVVANGEDETVTFATENSGKTVARLNLNITRNSSLIDRAIVRFSEGSQLPKFQLNPNHTKIYMSVDGKDYAIVNATEMGEMPVNFKAESDGSYTLSVNAEEVSFAYLHLIDNMTGIETDLLANPSYNFEARTIDYANRFKLVFATGNNSNEDSFAFFSNGSLVINNEGNATVQVIDVTGRIIKSESINGCANVSFDAVPGVYMVRLINGDNMKVQKVVK